MDIAIQTSSHWHILYTTHSSDVGDKTFNQQIKSVRCNTSDAIIIINQTEDDQIKPSQLNLRRIRSDGEVLGDGTGRGVERKGNGEVGGYGGRGQ